MKQLDIELINQFLEEDRVSEKLRTVLEIFNAALNDWPVEVNYLFEYNKIIFEYIGAKPNKKNIENTLKKIDLSQDAWKAESLAQIIDLFSYYEDGCSLEDIIDNLQKEVGNYG